MYLQIDEGFVGHPKTRAFCGRMQDPNAAMYLIKLWTWAVRSAPTGDLSEMNAWSIEDVVGYRLADGKCYAAMVACGFVDESEDGAPTAIHNWAKRTGGDIAKMETEANRKRLLRAHKGGTCEPTTCQFHRRATDAATDVVVTSAGHPADTSGTADGRRLDDRHQDKASPVQSKQDLNPPPVSGPMRSDPDHQAGARSNSGAIEPSGNPGELPIGPVTSYALTRLFGKIREREVGGLPWAGVRSSGGRDATMAEEINADPNARVDIAPSMALLFRWAREGRAGPRSAQILKDPTFAFASWCTSWTALREELHGAAPKVPAAAKPPDPGLRPWQQHDKAEERRKATERSEGRVALAQLTRELADGKAVAG